MFEELLKPGPLIIILVLVLLLFGSKKLPEAARGLGRSMRIFKSEIKSMEEDGKAAPATPSAVEPPPAQAPAPAPQQTQPEQPQG
jgi:sec-independent protein translocase protein TatA